MYLISKRVLPHACSILEHPVGFSSFIIHDGCFNDQYVKGS